MKLLAFVFASISAFAAVVAKDGSGDFQTVQAAVDAAPAAGSTIRIKPGIYEEKITIDKAHIHLIGLGEGPAQVVLSYHLNATAAGGTGKSASTTVTGDDFTAENLTFENTFSRGKPLAGEGSQAVALRVTGDRAVFRKVRFLGYQDTLYPTTSGCMNGGGPGCKAARQYFEDCYIEGNVDFIFGDALAFFENCEIHSLAHGVVAITAQSKQRADEKSGYVFNHCKLTAEAGAQKVYLGRPWRSYASVVYMNTYMGPEIMPAGWLEWEHGGPSLPTAFYAEYNSSGPGAKTAERDSHSVQLTAAQAKQYEVRTFLRGDDGWDPAAKRP